MKMAEALILEFDGLGVDDYRRVNELLGVDVDSGEGDWPAGLITHVGGAKNEGWVVFELWASRADQERFLAERLGPALAAAGVEGPPARMEWIEVAAHQTPGA
jgi:hypothetical protein